jgi:hypothetical protein
MDTQKLIRIMVMISLLGFITLSGYVFYACIGENGNLNEPILYVYNILNGLVGGIFALSFGLPAPPSHQRQDALGQKLHNLSTMVDKSESSDNWGYFYALSYMIVGFASIVLWLFKSDTGICENITSFAQIFLGMMVAIVTGYFRNNTTEQNL